MRVFTITMISLMYTFCTVKLILPIPMSSLKLSISLDGGLPWKTDCWIDFCQLCMVLRILMTLQF